MASNRLEAIAGAETENVAIANFSNPEGLVVIEILISCSMQASEALYIYIYIYIYYINI